MNHLLSPYHLGLPMSARTHTHMWAHTLSDLSCTVLYSKDVFLQQMLVFPANSYFPFNSQPRCCRFWEVSSNSHRLAQDH